MLARLLSHGIVAGARRSQRPTMSIESDVLQALQTRQLDHSLPGRFYNDPAIFALDMEAIFHRQWLFAGCTCEVEDPGQYLTVSIGPSSIIIARGNDGVLRGFHNTCRHRG